jgi:Response regulator containing a CheY-like receiver domain and an HD-GYP domain
LGGIDCITKPFNKSEVLSRINTHVQTKVTIQQLKITE